MKKWRKDERGLSTQRGCFCRYGARRIQRQLQGAVRKNAVYRQLPTSWQGTAFSVHSCNVGRKALKKRYKSITDRMRRSGAGRESAERSLSVICLFHPSCDIINHKNTTARVNVTGSIRVKPGSRCPCERGVFVQGYRALVTTHGQHLVE